MATARYRVSTPGVDIDAKATAFEGQLNISLAEVVGYIPESGLTNAPVTEIVSRNAVEIEVTGTATSDITTAATAVGDVDLVPGTLSA